MRDSVKPRVVVYELDCWWGDADLPAAPLVRGLDRLQDTAARASSVRTSLRFGAIGRGHPEDLTLLASALDWLGGARVKTVDSHRPVVGLCRDRAYAYQMKAVLLQHSAGCNICRLGDDNQTGVWVMAAHFTHQSGDHRRPEALTDDGVVADGIVGTHIAVSGADRGGLGGVVAPAVPLAPSHCLPSTVTVHIFVPVFAALSMCVRNSSSSRSAVVSGVHHRATWGSLSHSATAGRSSTVMARIVTRGSIGPRLGTSVHTVKSPYWRTARSALEVSLYRHRAPLTAGLRRAALRVRSRVEQPARPTGPSGPLGSATGLPRRFRARAGTRTGSTSWGCQSDESQSRALGFETTAPVGGRVGVSGKRRDLLGDDGARGVSG